MSNDTGYRLALGLLASSALDDTYDMGRWARPSDMPDVLDWLILGDSDQFRRYEDYVNAFDYSRGAFGNGSFNWLILCTLGMIDQLRTDFFGASAGNPYSGSLSAIVTARTYDSTSGGGWIKVAATLHWPSEDELIRTGHIWQVPLKFYDVQVLTGGFDSAFDDNFDT